MFILFDTSAFNIQNLEHEYKAWWNPNCEKARTELFASIFFIHCITLHTVVIILIL